MRERANICDDRCAGYYKSFPEHHQPNRLWIRRTRMHIRPLCVPLTALLAATLLFPGRAFAAGADTKPVTAAVDQLLDAFNRRDAAKFAAAFTEDGDFIDPRGGRVHGRK